MAKVVIRIEQELRDVQDLMDIRRKVNSILLNYVGKIEFKSDEGDNNLHMSDVLFSSHFANMVFALEMIGMITGKSKLKCLPIFRDEMLKGLESFSSYVEKTESEKKGKKTKRKPTI